MRPRAVRLAAVIAAAATVTLAWSPGAQAQPEATARSNGVPAGCRVTWSGGDSWPGGQRAAVTVAAPLAAGTPWQLSWTAPAGTVVTQAWGADVVQAGTATAAAGTADGSGTATFGLTASTPGETRPAGVMLDGSPCALAVAPAAVKVTKKCRTAKNGKKTCRTVTKTVKGTKTGKPSTGPTTTSGIPTSTSPQPDVVLSSTFEDATTQGWTARGPETLAATTSAAHSGTRSLQVSGRTAAWNGPTRDVASVLQAGRTYQLAAYVRLLPGEATTTLNLTVERGADGTTSYDHVSEAVTTTASGWSRLSGSYTVPAGATTLRLYAESASDTAGFLLDDVVVSTGSIPVTPEPTPSTTSPTTTTPDPTTSGPWPPSSTFTNPVLWEDLADLDIVRVGDTYYYSASNMHYSPGAPILRSYDLVNWEYAGHSLPTLDFGSKYDMSGGRAYVKGSWASFLNYRPSNRTFYWGGCIEFGRTYLYTATSVEGPWNRLTTINKCYYDAGMMVDDDDTMYVAYGNTTLSVAQLSADGRTEVRSQQVFQTPSNPGTLEGSRMFKRNGAYYIFVTKPANGQYILKSTNGPFGPYTMRQVLLNLRGPINGGGVPHQGTLVQTAAGQWYYMGFIDAFPGGRVPTLAPVTWTADGWPELQTVNGAWGTSYPYPAVPRPPRAVASTLGTDRFTSTTLGPQWEWNHNPDTTKWSAGNGLRLQTATVTDDLYNARNTLTHRIRGPVSTATIELDYAALRDGDRAGLAMLRDVSAWIGVVNDGGSTRLAMTTGLTMDSNWNTTSKGTVAASVPVSGGKVWLRATADVAPGGSKQATFWYSVDGVSFQRLGPAFTMNSNWTFFMGYRFAMFAYATKALGGAATVRSFTIAAP
ncbi:MAG: family 43 glycosylhydrolase [Kineosporiaceae bacterium]